jgi:hypothetical protein
MDKISRRHLCGALLAVLAVASLPVDARNLAGAARAALQRKAAQEAAQKAAVQGKPKDVIIRRSQHPAAAEHIEHAQRHGQPTVLHVDRAGADARRRASIGTVNRETRPAKGLRPRRVSAGLHARRWIQLERSIHPGWRQPRGWFDHATADKGRGRRPEDPRARHGLIDDCETLVQPEKDTLNGTRRHSRRPCRVRSRGALRCGACAASRSLPWTSPAGNARRAGAFVARRARRPRRAVSCRGCRGASSCATRRSVVDSAAEARAVDGRATVLVA